jgi:hypothetical protein
MNDGQEQNLRIIVSIGGMFGKLDVLHNLNSNRIVFKVTDAADNAKFASFEMKQIEHIRILLSNYLESLHKEDTPKDEP